MQNRISETGGLIQESGTRFTERRDIVASLSMTDRYQDKSAYQPLVFDPEKKRLADALADLLQAAGLPQGVLLTRSDPVAGFSGERPAYRSYDDSGRPVPWLAAARGLPYTRNESVPPYLQIEAPTSQALAGVVRVRVSVEDSVPMVEGVFPLLRSLTDDEKEVLIAAVPENFPPYYLQDSNGQPSGFAVETMTRIAEIAGLQLRYSGETRLGEHHGSPALGRDRSDPTPSAWTDFPSARRWRPSDWVCSCVMSIPGSTVCMTLRENRCRGHR